MARRRLKDYRKKRNLRKSKEPGGGRRKRGGRHFVIQKHDASSLHYDFRLQVGGALYSWAVPKGPSTDPRKKRLAIQTEDHPLGYIDFEGVIPEGEYGAGTVMVWDTGPYRNLRAHGENRRSMEKAHREGLIEVWLEGEKLRGGYALKRLSGGKAPQWLLIKMDDDEADARRNPLAAEPRSVKSGRTLKQIRQDEKDEGE